MSSLQATPLDQTIRFSDARYIKLGPAGAWERRCLEEGIVALGHSSISNDLAAKGDWAAVRQAFLAQGCTPAKASDFTRELRDFYTLPSSTLWVTISDGRLWWTFAEETVVPSPHDSLGARQRASIGGWRCDDVRGHPLLVQDLSTRLTRVFGYRQTLCRVGAVDYLARRLNATPEPAVAAAIEAQHQLTASVETLIQGLHWREFELLIDLIFANSGWRRVSGIGGADQADTDLILEQIATGERAMVQVKSTADQSTLDEFARHHAARGGDRGFFIHHSSRAALTPPRDRHFHLWDLKTVSGKAIAAGLVPWLIARTR